MAINISDIKSAVSALPDPLLTAMKQWLDDLVVDRTIKLCAKPLVAIYDRDGRLTVTEIHKHVGKIFVRPSPYLVEAGTLGEAIRHLERFLGVEITPFDENLESSDHTVPERKYFRYLATDGTSYLTDIHVRRSGEEICPKQDLDFVLKVGDVIILDSLIC